MRCAGIRWVGVVALLLPFSVGCGGAGGTGGVGAGGGFGAAGTLLNTGNAGSNTPGDELQPSSPGELMTIVRDFKFYDENDPTTNPDFENVPKTDQDGIEDRNYLGPWYDRDIVADTIGPDRTPTYRNPGAMTLTTHGQAAFNAWFHDVPGTNLRVNYPLRLTSGGNGEDQLVYDSEVSGIPGPGGTKMFFPIDDETEYATQFGNQGKEHNYSFTLELHTVFTYTRGQRFLFRGDDDVFVYVDGKLVINLGGIHGAEQAEVDFDKLQLTEGTEYPLDFFYAERHVTMSNMRIVTTKLDLETVVVTPK